MGGERRERRDFFHRAFFESARPNDDSRPMVFGLRFARAFVRSIPRADVGARRIHDVVSYGNNPRPRPRGDTLALGADRSARRLDPDKHDVRQDRAARLDAVAVAGQEFARRTAPARGDARYLVDGERLAKLWPPSTDHLESSKLWRRSFTRRPVWFVQQTSITPNISALIAGNARPGSWHRSARNVPSHFPARSLKPSVARTANIAPSISIAQWPPTAAAAWSAKFSTNSNTGSNAISVIRWRDGSPKVCTILGCAAVTST